MSTATPDLEILLDESLLDAECKCESRYDKTEGVCTNNVVARVNHCAAPGWFMVCTGYYEDQDCAYWGNQPWANCECGKLADDCWKVVAI